MLAQPIRTRRILIVDDSEAIRRDYKKVFEKQVIDQGIDEIEAELFGTPSSKPTLTDSVEFELDLASQGMEAVELAQRLKDNDEEYDVAFVDMRMPPGWDGVATVEELWKVDPNLNVVICTAYSDYSWEEIIGRLGITDRLLILKKPFDKVEVMQMAMTLSEKKMLTVIANCRLEDLRNVVEVRTEALQSEIRDRRVMEQELLDAKDVLEHQASHDTVTGLWNRPAILARFEQSLQVNRKAQKPTSMLFADIDQFNAINDTYGDFIGDAVLAEVGRRINTVLSEYDHVGRYGGEEFLIVLPACAEDVAPSIGNRLIDVVRSKPMLIGENKIDVTISVGVATSGKDVDSSVVDLLKQLDSAVAAAKTCGGNCVKVSSQEVSDEEPCVAESTRLEEELNA